MEQRNYEDGKLEEKGRLICHDSKCQLLHREMLSEPFEVWDGVKQECVIIQCSAWFRWRKIQTNSVGLVQILKKLRLRRPCHVISTSFKGHADQIKLINRGLKKGGPECKSQGSIIKEVDRFCYLGRRKHRHKRRWDGKRCWTPNNKSIGCFWYFN